VSTAQKFRLIIVLWVMWLLGTLPAAAGDFKPASGRGVPDVYTVVLKEGVAHKPHGPRKELPAVAQVAQDLARAHGGRVEEVWEHALQGFVARMPEARARKLAEDPRILVVEQDFSFSAPVGDCYFGTPAANTRPLPSSTSSQQVLSCSDPDPLHDTSPTGSPLCVDNWGIDRIDQLSAARDNRFYFVNNGRNPNTTVHIYVLDTGIRASHREFLAANGFSRVFGGADARPNPVDDGPTADTSDCYGHGTHVAGIIAGRTYGVAKDAVLHPVRIIGCPGQPTPSSFITTVTRALNWISSHAQRPAVINWSGGNALDVVANATLGAAVQGVLSQGIVLVQAAGNQSPDYNPEQPSLLRDACDWSFGEKYPGVIVAGGMDEYEGRWTRRPSLDPDDARYCGADCGSNAGSCVDLWAPASHILSTNMSGNDLSCRLSGTSMAAPHVTGVVAVYLEDHPNATISEVEQALRSRGTWNALESGAGDPNTIGPASDNVIVYSDTRSAGLDLPPVGTFTVTCQGRTCSLNATGSTDDYGITSYLWQLGDGSSGAGSVVQHRFPPGFNGRVTLTVTDGLNHTDHFSKVVTVQIEPRDALVSYQAVPASMVTGAIYPVSVTLKNVGTLTWNPIGPQCDAYRLGSANPYNNSTWGLTRVDLPAPVPPGGTVKLNFNVTAPATSGLYTFQWQMVQECVAWFGDSPSLNVPVTVFADVPLDHWARQFIEAIYRQGITSGCAANPLRYCPEDGVSRAQAAVLLLRAKGPGAYVPPACTTPVFTDVPCTHWAAPWVNEFARRGITAGCGGGNYCPDPIVDRGTMAYFLLATLGVPAPTTCTGVFSDVPCNVWYAPWVEELYRRGITAGCGGGQYCPTSPVSRAEMAVFLVRTFGVPFP
jgi:hypothetical protein